MAKVNTKVDKETFVVSKVKRVFEIKADKKTFPNKEDVRFVFKANVPQRVPAYVAQALVNDYPQVFSLVDEKEAETILANVKNIPPATEEEPEVPFDAVEFLNQTSPLTKEVLLPLSDKQLFAISAAYQLPVALGTERERHIDMIVAEYDRQQD